MAGVSVRTLHYYDEIGLLKPTGRSGSGYRLYDEAALETLRQILFFREFDLPLKEIKAVIDNPAFDKNQILRMQRSMLAAKKERMERLIASISLKARAVKRRRKISGKPPSGTAGKSRRWKQRSTRTVRRTFPITRKNLKQS
ncbi:MerR family transcriptional regulator [Lachnoclostridium sp. Marseille-P6806]|uniref:MerR family transcriptional regulator n=1 Tax=Lachnoclostridium sp. Marseille-P6806 TaxID=2364793 RepID=UPI002FE6C235